MFGPEKPVPRPVPAKQELSERPEAVKTRLLARDRKIFLPLSWQKNTGPTFDRRGRGDSLDAGEGEAPKLKTSALCAARFSLPAAQRFGAYRMGGLSTAATLFLNFYS